MRKDESAELMLYCPTCGNTVNEYNWTLGQAARYSKGNNRTVTLISILLKILNEPNFRIGEEKFMCPRCNERIKIKNIPLPDADTMAEYIARVGEEYVYAKY
ncbi:MAG: hypothetical protein GX333_00635 [Syntrophomonadaceae bacterium]|nr:hypothetical protein [Syntrophomonadaceae bacterium]